MEFIKLILFACFCINNTTSLDCYWNSKCKYKYFSSKTPYENVRGDIRDSIVKPKECEPISIWFLGRHGKRNPGGKFAKHIKEVLGLKNEILSNYEKGYTELCAQDVDNFIRWTLNESFLSEPNELNIEGYMEIVGIGSRLKRTFPELLSNLRETDYQMHPLYGNRIVKSTQGFIEGLGNKSLIIDQVLSGYDDLAPYTTCGKYQIGVKQNLSEYFEEEAKYLENLDYLQMKARIEKKLGLNLTNNQIMAIYDICRYSWEGIGDKPSPWCAFFTTEDLKVLEYIGDLAHYYRNGYGTELSEPFGQITLSHLLRDFEQAKDGKGKKITAIFGHATLMDMILVALKLFKDENPLTGLYRDSNRKWRSSICSTFAANLISVLYRCRNPSDSRHKIAFYWNEQPLLEMCKDGVCSWQEFENKFKPFLNATADFCEFQVKPH